MSSNSLTPQFEIADQDFSAPTPPSAPATRPRRLQAQALAPKFEVVDAPEPQFEVVDAPPVTMNQRRGSYTGPTLTAEDTVPKFGSKEYFKAIPGAVAETARSMWQERPRASEAPQLAAGAVNAFTGPGPTPGITPEIGTEAMQGAEELGTPGKRLGGAAKLVSALGDALTPFLGVAGLENPAGAAKALASGYVGSKGAKAVTKARGGGEQAQDLAETLGFWAPTTLGILHPRLAVGVSPEEIRVGAGIAPPGMEPKAATISIPRGPRPSPSGAAGIEAPTIEGNAQAAPIVRTDPSAEKIAAYDIVMQNAQKVVNGESITPPAPPSEPVHEIGTQQIQELGGMLAKLPENVRAQAIIETHGTLSKLLLQQGKIVANGKLEVIKTPEQADSVAQRLINDEIGRRDKEAETAAKEADRPEKPVARSSESAASASQAATKVSSRQKAEQLAQPKFEVVERPAPKFEVVDAEAPKVESGNGNKSGVESLSAAGDVHNQVGGKVVRVPAGEGAVPTGLQHPNPSPAEVSGANVAGRVPEPASAGNVSPAGNGQTFTKGDSVAFSKNFQIPKGNGQSEIIRTGTKAAVEYVNPDMKFARVRAEDGRVHSVPFKYLEGANGNQVRGIQPEGQANGGGLQPSSQPVVARAEDNVRGLREDQRGEGNGVSTEPARTGVAQSGEPAAAVASEKKPVTPQVESGTKYVLPSFVTHGLSQGEKKPLAEGHWMNRHEVEEAAERHAKHPVLGKATNFLKNFMDEVDSHSDGWPYWSAASNAAKQLMTVIHNPESATEDDFQKALGPIKSFMTKRGTAAGMTMPKIAGETPHSTENKAAPTAPSESKIGAEKPHVEREDQPERAARKAEDLSSVSEPARESRVAPTEVSPEGKPATEGQGNAQLSAGRESGERLEHPSGREGERPAPERSGGTGERDLAPTEREAGRGRPARPRGADGKPVVAPTPEPIHEAKETTAELRNQRNFHISDEETAKIGSGGEISKIKGNLDALETLKKIQKEGRETATPEEQETLAKYVDFGGLVGMLQRYWEPQYAAHYKRFTDLLSPAEIQEIRETLPNTHYTSMQVVDWTWKAMQRMGFRGGRVLEPGMGIGNFMGRIPEKMSGKSEFFGVERNPLTGSMAKLLYPDAHIAVKPFQHFQVPNNSLDAVIGNVPFQDVEINDDPAYKGMKLNLHNYFIVKALDKLKPGGVGALITSRYTMDSSKGSGQRAREEMAKRADLITAIRLPDHAFKRTAGTEVVADLLVFRKKAPVEETEKAPEWTTVAPLKVGDKEFMLNKYFVDHPDHVLGEHSAEGKMYGPNQYTVKGPEDFGAALEGALENLFPKNVYGKTKAVSTDVAPRTLQAEDMEFAPEDVKPGAFFKDAKGNLRIKEAGVGVKLPENLNTPEKREHISKAIDLRDQLNQTIQAQLSSADDTKLKQEQASLGKLYDEYRQKYGSLHGPKLRAAFGDDPEYPKLLALENLDPETKQASKAAIFTKRVLAPYEPLRDLPDDPKSSMLKVIAERGYLDTKLMAELLKKPEQEVIGELEDKGLVFQDPEGGHYLTADEYLSGNVREKLVRAERAAEVDKRYRQNVEALKKAQPAALTIHDIQPALGQTWIPTRVYEAFVKHLAQSRDADVEISRDATGKWLVQHEGNRIHLDNEWGGGGIPGHKLVQYALNQQQPTVWDVDADGNRTVNAQATTAAREKLGAIKEEFRTVLRQAPDKVVQELEQIYNDTFNAFKLREFSGEHLDFPGMSQDWRDKIRGYQKAAIWRILQEGRAGIFHAPGLGKTLTMAAAGMEARRLKLSRKNLYAVPNHMVEQWREDFKTFYPNANVLAVQDEDFTATNRARLMSRIATGDWDAVIVPHSQFDLLPMSPKWEKKTIDKRLADYRLVLEDLDGEKDKRTIKQIEKAIDKLEARLAKLDSKQKDNTIPFDQLGVDMMFVDEAHAYKAMAVPSKMGNIGGISNRASQRALAMEMKSDFMRDTHKGRGVVFGTGTPITNTVGELYVMTKYLAPEMLEAAGIRSFDDWAANFATTITQWEYAADGVTFKPKTTLSEFVNVPELSTMFRRYAEYLSKDAAKQLANIKLPEVDRRDHMLQVTPTQEPLLQMVAERGDELTKHPPRTKEERQKDNWLKLSGDARKISLDPRLYDPSLNDDSTSKANEAVGHIKDILDSSADKKGTVAVFSDFFQHHGADGKPDFNLFEDMRNKLAKAGVPRSQIAVIHEAESKLEKEELFAKVRAGKVRVIFGSTDKMGIGTNIQDRLKAELHLDQPWRPDQVEQREGRIERSGNQWDKVQIHRYIAEPKEGTIKRWSDAENKEVEVPRARAYDLQMYQQLARKAHFQEQFLTGNYSGRTMEDVGGEVRLNSQMFEMAKAMATGNPDAIKKIKLEHDLTTYGMLERNFQVQRSKQTRELAKMEFEIPIFEKQIELYQRDIKTWKAAEENKEGLLVDIGGKTYQGDELKEYLKGEPNIADLVGQKLTIGGLETELVPHIDKVLNKRSGIWEDMARYTYRLAGEDHYVPYDSEKDTTHVRALVHSFADRARGLNGRLRNASDSLETGRENSKVLREQLKQKSQYADKVKALEDEVRAIDKRLHVTPEQDEGAAPAEDNEEKGETPATTPKEARPKEAGFATPGMLVPEKLLNAGEKVFEAAARAYDHLTEPPKWEGIQALTRKWTGAENYNAWELEQFTKAIKEAVPSKLKREALSNWIEAAGDQKILKKWADQSKLAYKKGYEAALDLTPEEEDVGRAIIRLHNEILEKAQDAGIVDEGVENYIQHIWEKEPQAARKILAQINFAGLQPNPAFAKRRTLPTYFEGEKLGFTPKDKDVGFLTAAHIMAFNKAIASREYVKSLFAGKAEDGRPLATASQASAIEVPGEDPRKDLGAYLVKPNIKKGENHLDYQPFDHPALRKWRWAGTNPDTGKPTLVQGDALLHPDVYQHVKNNLSRSALQTWTVKALGSEFQPGRLMLNASSQIKSVILSLSGFHQLTEALRGAEHRQFPAFMPELDLEDVDQRFAVDHGLMVAEYAGLDAFSEGVASGGIVTKIPLLGPAYDVYRNYLFKSYIPRLKMAVFEKALERNQKTYPDLSRDQAGMLTADQVNATFGGLNYKALGRNPTVQDVLRLSLLAPDFVESTFRSEGQAGKSYGREQLTAILVGATVLYTALRLLNQLTDGKPHFDKPFSLVANGKEYSVRTRAADLLRMVEDPLKFAYGRISPLGRTGMEQLTGRDQEGHKSNLFGQMKEGVGEVAHGAKEALKGNPEGGFEAARGLGKATGQNVPIPLQPFTSDRGDQSTAEKVVESMLKMIGVNVKKFHSAAEEEAYKISRDKGSTGEFTQEERDRYYARQRALDGLRKGDSKPLEEALEKGLIRPKEIKTLIHRSMGSPLYDRVIGFSYAETQRVYDKAVADHDEKAEQELFPLLMEKLQNEIKRGQFNNEEVPSEAEAPALSLQ